MLSLSDRIATPPGKWFDGDFGNERWLHFKGCRSSLWRTGRVHPSRPLLGVNSQRMLILCPTFPENGSAISAKNVSVYNPHFGPNS
jgi:hypothetical protein